MCCACDNGTSIDDESLIVCSDNRRVRERSIARSFLYKSEGMRTRNFNWGIIYCERVCSFFFFSLRKRVDLHFYQSVIDFSR